MRNHKRRSCALFNAMERKFQVPRIQRRKAFIKYHDLRLLQQRPCNE
jgi:hypothetical protein